MFLTVAKLNSLKQAKASQICMRKEPKDFKMILESKILSEIQGKQRYWSISIKMKTSSLKLLKAPRW